MAMQARAAELCLLLLAGPEPRCCAGRELRSLLALLQALLGLLLCLALLLRACTAPLLIPWPWLMRLPPFPACRCVEQG